MICRVFGIFPWIAMGLAVNLASAGTYHVRADGTAATKTAATSCTSPATAMDVGGFHNESFAPGDRIVLCHEGGVFRSSIYLGAGGLSGSPITYDGRGTAVLSGSDIVSEWTRDSGNVYVADFSVQPAQVFIDGVFGDRKSSKAAVTNDHDWFWESNNLFLYSSGGDPDTTYNSPGVEAGARDLGLGFGGQDYVVIEGVTARHTNLSGIKGWDPGSHVTIRNCAAEWNWHLGIDLNGNVPYDNVTIEDNIVRFNGTGGVAFMGPGSNSVIRRNQCYSNGKFQSATAVFEGQHQWTFGIKLWEFTSTQEGNQVYFNECYENGRGSGGDYQGRGVGIWLDGIPGNPSNLNVIRHNLVYDNAGNGIFIEISSNTVIQGNVLHNNATNTGGGDGFAPASIAIDSREDFVSENNLVFNNTSVGGRYGIKIVTYDWQGCSVDNNIVKNNIVVGSSEHNLFALFGGDNDGVNGSGNVYEYNNFGEETQGFIRWGWSEYDTYDGWEIAYGLASHSIEGDPRLVGTSPTALYLTAESPCRDTGVNLGSDYDQGLLESSLWTSSVETDDQDFHGVKWEVGAFCFSGAPRPIFVDGFENGSISKWSDSSL